MFCRNCGKELPENTRFCNHCGAAQDSAPAQPVPATKKKTLTIAIVAAVAVIAVVLGVFVIAPALSGDTKPAGDGQASVADGSAENDSQTGENSTAAQTKPPVDGKVTRCKIYELNRADNDKISIELYYREGSDYVANLSGTIYIPAGSEAYDSAVADNIAFEQKVKATNLPEDLMQFGYGEVNLEDGYVNNYFSFKELDAENASSVAMIAEFLGLPADNGYFMLSDCERYLLENGLELTYET